MNCLYCGKKLTNRQTKYCSNKCQSKYQQIQYIQDWQKGIVDGLKGEYGISNYIRNYLLEKNNYKCEKCGWGEINPYTKTLPLEIHHKDGNYKNNNENNLQVLCPNCHSLTETYKAANKNGRTDRHKYNQQTRKKYFCIDCGKEISDKATRCQECNSKLQRTVERPNREELKNLIRNFPFTQIAKKFNVSDNAIKKWCDTEHLPRKKTDINKYSDEEWKLI